MVNSALVAGSIFILTYTAIISERIERATVAMFGAAAMVVAGLYYGFLTQHAIITEAIDWNTIGLLLGMMLIVGVLEETGLFESLAVLAARLSRGDYFYLIVMFGVLTAFGSMTLDNVTTVLLVAPVSLQICQRLDVDSKPVLLAEASLSNVGGVGTLVGDPPNIMIGSAGDLTYLEFVVNLGPVVVVCIVVSLAVVRFIYRDQIHEANEKIRETGGEQELFDLHPRNQVENWSLLYKSVGVLLLVTVMFALHHEIGLEPATVALMGAALLFIISAPTIEETVPRVEWTTLLFFAGLFTVVHGVQETGILTEVARALLDLTAGDTELTVLTVLFVSAIGSGIVDNIPFTAAMLPIIPTVASEIAADAEMLWWALALGAGFGGNSTYIGSSATVVAVKLSERTDDPINFMYWLRYGTLIMVITVLVSALALYVQLVTTMHVPLLPG